MPIRSRTPSETTGLPTFDFTRPFANVCKAAARIDHFEVNYYAHKIQYAHEAAFRGWRDNVIANGFFHPVFERTSAGRQRLKTELDFPEGGLIAGRRVRLTRSDLRVPRGVRMRDTQIHLNLNFTRFYQNNALIDENLPDAETYGQRPRVPVLGNNFFIIDEDRMEAGKQAVLQSGKDNIFTFGRGQQLDDVAALATLQVMMCQDYIEQQFIENQRSLDEIDANKETFRSLEYLTPALTDRFPVAPLFNWDSFSIPHLEIYWDMFCHDAEQVIERLSPALARHTREGGQRHYPHDANREGNTTIHRIHYTKAIYFRIYAKTQQRIRFEVVYHRNLRNVFQRRCNANTSLYTLIDLALNDATEKLHSYLSNLHIGGSNMVVQNKPAALGDLLEELHDAFNGDYVRIKHFLVLLSRFGSINSPTRQSQQYQHLVDRGVMTFRSVRGSSIRTYTLTDRYAWVLQAMMV